MEDQQTFRFPNLIAFHFAFSLFYLFTILPATRKARRRYNKNPTPLNRCVKSLLNSTTRATFSTSIDEKLQDPPTDETINSLSERLMKVIKDVADLTLPKRKKVKSTKEIWKDDEHLNLLLMERGESQRGSQSYRSLTKTIKKRVNKLRNEKMKQEAEEINQFATNREVEELFRSFKADGSTFKSTKRKSGCDQDKLKEYFEKHFAHSADNHPEPEELVNIPDFIKELQTKYTPPINTGPPDKKEIKSTLCALKNGKSSSDIPAEFLKYASASDNLLTELQRLFNEIWISHTVPTSWGHSKLIALWKGASKGSAKDPSTYRGLQVGSTLCKIMVTIILNRLSDWYDTHLLDQQQGFRRGRGTTDGIFITKRIQQISDKTQKPSYLLFIDPRSAFDHVIRKWLFKSIYQRFPPNVDVTLIKLLEALYSHTTTALADNPDDVF
ncbi:MAG: reverse transcriptase domain-containing protein, partial [Pseudomonadota bacterium]